MLIRMPGSWPSEAPPPEKDTQTSQPRKEQVDEWVMLEQGLADLVLTEQSEGGDEQGGDEQTRKEQAEPRVVASNPQQDRREKKCQYTIHQERYV